MRRKWAPNPLLLSGSVPVPPSTPPAAFVQNIGAFANGAGATVTTLTVAKTITPGNTIFVVATQYVAAAGTDSVTDNLGNTYVIVEGRKSFGPGLKCTLYAATISIGGSLTAITFNHIAANYNALAADEFSNVGLLATVGGAAGNNGTTGIWDDDETIPSNGIAVGGLVHDGTGGDDIVPGANSGNPASTIVAGSQVGTIRTGIFYALPPSVDTPVTNFTGRGIISATANILGCAGNFYQG